MAETSAGRRCVFCGGRGLTNEHALPAWISRDVFNDAASVEHSVLAQGHSPRTFSSNSFDQTVKQVCGPCNHGWMSQLEVEARGVIEPMLRYFSRTQSGRPADCSNVVAEDRTDVPSEWAKGRAQDCASETL
jgi:hypothetical protein